MLHIINDGTLFTTAFRWRVSSDVAHRQASTALRFKDYCDYYWILSSAQHGGRLHPSTADKRHEQLFNEPPFQYALIGYDYTDGPLDQLSKC